MLFVSREPVFHERNGATTAATNLLQQLRDSGADVTVLVTLAASRSPRLRFCAKLPLPAGTHLRVPGYLRFGEWFLRPFTPWTWLRRLLRLSDRVRLLQPLRSVLQHAIGNRLFAGSWDLNEPTRGEASLVLDAAKTLQPDVVIANYACWGLLLAQLKREVVPEAHTAILMHDLLAEHVRLFREQGMPLDCNPITREQELAWLNGADTLIAVQQREADAIRGHVQGEVLVQPIEMPVALPVASGSGACEAGRCLFVGSGSPPNVQGAVWLLQKVWPHVLRVRPGAVLVIAGDVCARLKPAPGVRLLGSVPSLAAEYQQASVCVVPLLVGTGLKIKLLEALRYGKATVSTGVGVQGVEAWVDDVVSVADDPALFASNIAAFFKDTDLRHSRERAAAALMQKHFGPQSAAKQALLARLFG